MSRVSHICTLFVIALLGLNCTGFTQQSKFDTEQAAKPQLARVHVSAGIARGLLIKEVTPRYPEAARKKHIKGPVVMRAIISDEGNVREVILLSGDPLLVPAASEAAKQWKNRIYSPVKRWK